MSEKLDEQGIVKQGERRYVEVPGCDKPEGAANSPGVAPLQPGPVRVDGKHETSTYWQEMRAIDVKPAYRITRGPDSVATRRRSRGSHEGRQWDVQWRQAVIYTVQYVPVQVLYSVLLTDWWLQMIELYLEG
jgi:hypothetical protein